MRQKSNRLNLPALRARQRDAERKSDELSALFSPGTPNRILTRREWLGVAGSAALVSAPALRMIGAAYAGPFEFTYDARQAVFSMRGKERWRIETSRFAGNPRLDVNRSEHRIEIGLSNARVPGTEVPADFTCTVTPALLGWEMQMEMALGGFRGRTGFELWLLGMAQLRGTARFPHLTCIAERSFNCSLDGEAEAEFSPDWKIGFSSPHIGLLEVAGRSFAGDRAVIALENPDGKSVIRGAGRKRASIAFDRGEHAWHLAHVIPEVWGWGFSSGSGEFDVARIEATENRSGDRYHVLLAESAHDDPVLVAHPGLSRAAGDTALFGLPLRHVSCALDLSVPKGQTAIVGRFSRTPVWLSAKGVALELGDAPGAEPFEFVADRRRVSRVRCKPALLRTLTSLPDAIAEPTRAGAGASVAIVAARAARGVQKSADAQIKIGPRQRTAVSLLKAPPVSIIRPEDFLSLEFEFVNLKLQGSGTGQVLARDTAGQPSFIIARFPPQNIAEEAFFETAAEFPIPKVVRFGKPVDPDASTKEPSLPNPPVQARLSGPSRLVFKIPSTVSSIPYTLGSLLKACSDYELNVTQAAAMLSPAQRAILVRIRTSLGQRSVASRSAAGALTNLQSAVQTAKGKSGTAFHSAIQSDLSSVKSQLSAFQQLPDALQPPRVVQKRIETLQNAIERDAKSHPGLVRLQVDALTSTMNGVTRVQPGVKFDPALLSSLIAMALKPRPANPTDTETAIEAPYRLIISPNAAAAWAHALKAVTYNGWTELWHTRLGVRGAEGVDEQNSLYRTIRAVWSPDYRESPAAGPGHSEGQTHTESDPFRMSLDRQDRHELVHLSADFKVNNEYVPLPVETDTMMLTALGAWMNLYGTWDPIGTPMSIETWRHRGTMGRDHYVRVVYAGFLFPFGHKATLLKVTERKFQKTPAGDMAAYLRQRMYIIVKQREKNYPGPRQSNDARRFPFRVLRVTTLVTPNLDSPSSSDISGKGQSAFWPFVGKKPFLFHMIGEDWDGRQSDFTAPVIFVDNGAAFDRNLMSDSGTSDTSVPKNYLSHDDYRTSQLQGQNIAFADSKTPGDTTLATKSISFGVELNTTNYDELYKDGDPIFYPSMEKAEVRLNAVEQLVGESATREIGFHDDYVGRGFGGSGNQGDVFAKLLAGQELALDFTADTRRSGGLVAPNAVITGLSRTMGAVAGKLEDMMQGSFDPAEFFASALSQAKLFGALDLTQIIDKVLNLASNLDRVPKLVNERFPTYIRTTYTWKPVLKSDNPADTSKALFVPNKSDGMNVSVEMRTPLNGDAPSLDLSCEIKDFKIQLIPAVASFLAINFESVALSVKNAEKPDVSVTMGEIEFLGPLSFVNTIEKYIDKAGFSDPPNLDVTSSGISASYSLPIPTIAIGVFSLQNIDLAAKLEVPFIGKALTFQFNFCTKENPFILTVTVFGGGGYFNITVSPSGLEALEAALEFGGSFALNLGVASGGVYVMAGIHYAKVGDTTSLDGFFRCGGGLEVLGLISVSVEFYLSLTYQTNGKMYGQGSLKVSIDILFFSTTVTLTVERQFKGAAGDPLFQDVMDPADWGKYLSAFA